MESGDSLPVNECLGPLVTAVAASIPVVLKAPPGAGKTTGVPPALLDAGIAAEGQILLVQPRRMAARAAASRLAALRGSKLGTEIGYHVRFDKCLERNTKLVAVTTGVLLRRLSSDPLLEDVACVILDEFHERSIEMDLVLGMLQRVRSTLRPELKLIVMSATLDPQPIVKFLGDAVSLESQGRSYPVTIEHTEVLSRDPIDQQVAAALHDVFDRCGGHILIFLPGVGEIRRVRRTLEGSGIDTQGLLLELYGDLSPTDQDAVLKEVGRRKIILSTNVAETSVTIPGVGAVIDTGSARVLQYDARVGLPKLQLEAISQASAEQRAGRAGRTQHGFCYRLWPQAMHRSRRSVDVPEVGRCDLSQAILILAAWGERDVWGFPWLTPPPADAVDAARTLLQRLDAIDNEGAVTPLGSLMMRLPLPPRLARFMIEATLRGIDQEAAIVAAMLSERDPFRGDTASSSTSVVGCDVTDRLERLQAFANGDRSAVANGEAARQIARAAKQILRDSSRLKMDAGRLPIVDKGTADKGTADKGSVDKGTAETISDRLKRALLAAFPDRLARRREPGSDRGILVGGRGVRLGGRSLARSGDFFLCIDVDAKGIEADVRLASQIDPTWLDPRHVRELDEPFFDASLAAVVARRRRYFHDLMLSESPIRCHPGPQVAQQLAAAARQDMSRVLPRRDGPLLEFIHQVRFLQQQMPQLKLPPLDDPAIDVVLETLCQTRTSFAELSSAPWLDHIRGRYDYQQLKQIEQHAPSRITVPSGNSIAIRYAQGKPPAMEVRIQELFGWGQTPRIAGGRVAIQMHLLGPNHRPQQITEDLASFWSETYAQVRKELRRRYPRHHWPEDPMNAAATRNGLKPRS